MTQSGPAASDDGLQVVARQLCDARERYLKRLSVYRFAGYDRSAAARFIVDQAGVPAGPVLDVGSGQGSLAIELARRGLDVTSVDVSPEEQLTAIANAQMESLTGRITFLTADARELAFDDGAFAAAATMDSLHHLAEGPPVFAEMVRVVRPTGRIVLAEFTEEGFALVARVHRSEGRDHPVGPVTIASAVEWFVAHRLKLERQRQGRLHSVVVFVKPA